MTSYKLNANPVFSSLSTKGNMASQSGMLIVSDDDSSSVYALSKLEGFTLLMALPYSIISNIVNIGGSLIFATKDSIMSVGQDGVKKLYDIVEAYGTTASNGAIFTPGGGLFCIIVNLVTSGSTGGYRQLFFDSAQGIYTDSTTDTVSSSSKMFCVYDGDIPDVVVYDATKYYTLSATDATAYSVSTWATDTVRDDTNRFYLRGVLLYLDVLSSTNRLGFGLNNNDSPVLGFEIDETNMLPIGERIYYYRTGSIPLSYPSWELSSVSGIKVNNVKLVGVFIASTDLATDTTESTTLSHDIIDVKSKFILSEEEE
jgi:hypothetical protein